MKLWTRSSFPLECPWRGFFVRKGPFSSSSSSSLPAFYIKRAKLYFALINRWATCYTWYDPTMHDAAANYDVNNVTRARACATVKLNLPWSIFNAEIFLRNGEGKESRVQRFPPFFGNRTFCRPLFPLFSLSEPISSAPPFPPCNSLFARLTAIISSF